MDALQEMAIVEHLEGCGYLRKKCTQLALYTELHGEIIPDGIFYRSRV